MNQSANLPTSQIGIRWSGTKKCSQRYEIDHFCLGIFAGIQPSEWFRDPVGESSNPIQSNPIKSNQIKSNQIQAMDQPIHQIKSNQIKSNQINESMNQIKSNQIKSISQSTNQYIKQPINQSINCLQLPQFRTIPFPNLPIKLRLVLSVSIDERPDCCRSTCMSAL